MGGEFAQSEEWSQEHGLQWWLAEFPEHAGVHRLVRELGRRYLELGALWDLDDAPAGFTWLDEWNAEENVIAFLRSDGGGHVVAVAINFSGVARDILLPLPTAGPWRELLNTDAIEFGGGGAGNLGRVIADAGAHRGWPASARVHLPALTAVWLAP